MANKKFLMEQGKESTLDFLNQLEKSCGGHGNGIMFIDNGVLTFDHKGLKLSNETIVHLLYDNKKGLPDWFLYHTRVASKGSVKDSNCHPYINEDRSFGLMMNGTISSLGVFGKHMGDITDTEVAFHMVDKFNLELDVLCELDPKFIGFRNGKVFATNPDSYSGLVFYNEDRAICIASESPDKEDWDSMKEEYVWIEGEKIEKATPKKSYGSYGYYGAYGNYKSTMVRGTYGGKKGYWLGGVFYEDKEEDCKACEIDNKKIKVKTIKEALDEIEKIKVDYGDLDSVSLQTLLDYKLGDMPILDNMYCEIVVLDDNNIIIQDELGGIHF